jgi:hypothetical protein
MKPINNEGFRFAHNSLLSEVPGALLAVITLIYTVSSFASLV